MRLLSLLVVAFLLSSSAYLAKAQPSFGQKPLRTSWGEGSLIESESGATGFIEVENPPASGELVFPADLPPIVRAFVTGGRPAPEGAAETFEFDPESGALILRLSKDSRESATRAVCLCAKKIEQGRHGTIQFPAQSAQVRGTTAKLESNGSNVRIGYWTNPKDEVVWPYDATRWGRYAVTLVYSTEAPDGAVAEIEFGGEKLDVELPSTGSWYRYRQLDAGEIYLADDGKTELIVRAKKLSGAALMNLKAVVLAPAFESPERPKPAADGSITLKASDAKIAGVKLRYEPKPEKNTLGYWTVRDDRAIWEFRVERPGTFDVEILQGCGTGQGGSKMALFFTGTVGGKTLPLDPLTFEVEETGHFQNFVARNVGRVVFDEAGDASLMVLPSQIAKAAACDIRQIRLIPVEEASAEKE